MGLPGFRLSRQTHDPPPAARQPPCVPCRSEHLSIPLCSSSNRSSQTTQPSVAHSRQARVCASPRAILISAWVRAPRRPLRRPPSLPSPPRRDQLSLLTALPTKDEVCQAASTRAASRLLGKLRRLQGTQKGQYRLRCRRGDCPARSLAHQPTGYDTGLQIINSLAKGRFPDAALLAAGVRPPPASESAEQEPLGAQEPLLLAHTSAVANAGAGGNNPGGQGELLQAHKAAFFFKLERELEKVSRVGRGGVHSIAGVRS